MPNLQSDVTTITLQGPQEKLESAKTLVTDVHLVYSNINVYFTTVCRRDRCVWTFVNWQQET